MDVAICPQHLDIISLCTGGGGLDLGVELAVPSARSVCMVEREAFAVAQLVSAMEAGLMAPAPIWSDARTFNGRQWRGCVDGVIGGIPCQPHSLAGKRLGEEDERDLWSDARRIIVQSGAWFVLIENVRGMLSSGGAERVWRDLHRLGFEVEGGLFTASEVGASHERERLFILAVADRNGEHGHGAGIKRSGWWGQSANGGGELASVGLADADCQRLEGIGANAGAQGRPDAGRQAGLCDGAALVHAERPERRADSFGRHQPDRNDQGRGKAPGGSREPSKPVGHADVIELRREPSTGEQPELQHQHGSGAGYLFPPGPSDFGRWASALERAPEFEPAFRRVAHGLATRLDIARVDRLRMLGNGVVPLEAAYAVRTLATRLAGRGATGATRLVRMMEAA